MKKLKGQTALVTGGAKRLGRALALALAKAGVDIVLHYHYSQAEAEETAKAIEDLGVSCWLLPANLTDPEQVTPFFEQAIQQAGPIDILINNASIYRQEALTDTNAASMQENMQLHATTPLVLARSLAAQTRPGHVINLLDTRAVCRDPQHISYHLSKRTLLTLTRLLAEELAPLITVNAVAPGLILPPEGEDETYLKSLVHTNALQRHGCCDDITDTALFLLQSEFITGQIIFVDGGHHMKGRLYE